MDYETITVHDAGGVLFAELLAPPMNLLGPELVRDLVSLIQRTEADETAQVLVFKSGDPEYFISHVDVTRIKEYRAEAAKLTGEASIALLFRYLSASRFVTIAQIEGRVRAGGSEFALACDMRFAARESAIFGQFEPAFGQVPGGGAAQHLTAPVDDFRRDSDLFAELVSTPEAQRRIGAALERGFQTRSAEIDLAQLLGDLPDD